MNIKTQASNKVTAMITYLWHQEPSIKEYTFVDHLHDIGYLFLRMFRGSQDLWPAENSSPQQRDAR